MRIQGRAPSPRGRVLGVAVILATAWESSQAKQAAVQVDGQNLRFVSLVDQAMKLIDQGKPVPDGMWSVIQELAKTEDNSPNWTVIGLAGVAVAGVLVWLGFRHYAGPKRASNPRRRRRLAAA